MPVTIHDLKKAIIAGENNNAVAIANALINSGIEPEKIIVQGVTKAMEYLDSKCTTRDFCLLELMLAGRDAMDVIDHLYTEAINPDEISHHTGC